MITSRPATIEDVDYIVENTEAMNAESKWQMEWSTDMARSYIEWAITTETTDILMAARDGVPVGGAIVAASWEFHTRPLCYVCKFWVVREHRRGDVSHAIVKDILQWSQERDCTHIFTTATAGLNKVEQMLFIRLFKAHGFDAVGPTLAIELGDQNE